MDEFVAYSLETRPGVEDGKRVMIGGSYVATVTEDEAQTPERYRAEADAWLAEQRAKRGAA